MLLLQCYDSKCGSSCHCKLIYQIHLTADQLGTVEIQDR
jgi:hypothetical protein